MPVFALEGSSDVDKMFGENRKPEQLSRPQMLQSSREGEKGFSDKRLLCRKGFHVQLGSERFSGSDTMSGRVDELMVRDVRRETCGFLCLVEEATLHQRGHVASSVV